MDLTDAISETDRLEAGLLLGNGSGEQHREEDGDEEKEPVLYSASFSEMEENFIKFRTAQWALYSSLLLLAWGIGLVLLLYLPVQRYILRKELRSRKLYLTPDAIVYKVTRPVPFPCFGVLRKEKHVVLPSVADIVIEQGYLRSLFGIYSIRIENNGLRRPPSDDVHIEGISNPLAFRKAVLLRLSHMRNEASVEGVSNSRDSSSHPGNKMILQKLEEIDSSVKRVQTFIEEQQHQTSETTDSVEGQAS